MATRWQEERFQDGQRVRCCRVLSADSYGSAEVASYYRTDFWFQHHVRIYSLPSNPHEKLVTLFSNGANQFEQTADTARGMVLRLNLAEMTAELEREYLPSFKHACSSEGSMHILDNGNVVIGWGIGALRISAIRCNLYQR